MKQAMFEKSIEAIIATAMEAYYEGYNQCNSDYQSPWNPKDVNAAWEMSDCKAACDKMIANLSGKNNGL